MTPATRLVFLLAVLAGLTAPAHGQIYVDKDATGAGDGTSWADAYTDLQTAIDNAGGSDVLWIAEGIYTPDSEDDSFVITGDQDGIELYGGFDGTETSRDQRAPREHRTILSGDIAGDDTDPDGDGIIENAANIAGDENAHLVLLIDGGEGAVGPDSDANITPETVVDGVTITAGDGDGDSQTTHEGGGLHCDGEGPGNQCSPSLRNIVLTGNQAPYGAAIYVDATEGLSNLTIIDARIEGNAAFEGGGIHVVVDQGTSEATLHVQNSVLIENTSTFGGALYQSASSEGLIDTHLTNVWFNRNEAEIDGGAVYNSGEFFGESRTRSVNAVFTGNRSMEDGGAVTNIAVESGTARMEIVNNTLTGNRAKIGGAVKNSNVRSSATSQMTITNSILWDNEASESGSEIFNEHGNTAITHSVIQGGANGPGVGGAANTVDGTNLDQDPRLVEAGSPAGPDGSFATGDDGTIPIIGSPVLDAGVNDSVTVDTDVTGTPRVEDQTATGTATVDIGAYEGITQISPSAVSDSVRNVTGTTAELVGRVDPNGAATTAQVAIAPTADIRDVRTISFTANPVQGASDKPLTIDVDALSPGTEYEARLIASNSEGNDRGELITFTTGTTGPPVATVDTPSTVRALSADLSGIVNPGGIETAVRFAVRRAGASSFQQVRADDSPLTGTTDQPVSASVRDLEPNTEYEVNVTASNAEGADEGNLKTFTTKNIGISVTGGGFGGLDRTFRATPGEADQPIGLVRVTPTQGGVDLTEVSVTPDNPGVRGVDRISLWISGDDRFDPSGDTELASLDLDPRADLPSPLTFGGFTETLPAEARTLFVAVTLTGGAAGEVTGYLADQTALALDGGAITEVNGNEQTGFSNLPLSGEGSTLPVELARFDGEVTDGGVRLSWRTTSEDRNAGFQVQRRAGRGSWSDVQFVEGAGTTSEPQRYRFTDADIPYAADSLSYRLKQVDADGTATLTDPITVARSGPAGLELLGTAPNPASRRATVRYGIPGGLARKGEEVRLELYDTLGRQVRSMDLSGTAGRHTHTLDVSGLPSGMYLLRLEAGGPAVTRKLTVVR